MTNTGCLLRNPWQYSMLWRLRLKTAGNTFARPKMMPEKIFAVALLQSKVCVTSSHTVCLFKLSALLQASKV